MSHALDQAATRYIDSFAPENDFAPRAGPACPVCGGAMQARGERGAVADVCPEHGVWFDQAQWVRFTSPSREPARPAPRRAVRGYVHRPTRNDLYESLFDLGGSD